MISSVSFNDLKSELLKEQEVKAEYDSLEKEYQLAKEIIALHQEAEHTQSTK